MKSEDPFEHLFDPGSPLPDLLESGQPLPESQDPVEETSNVGENDSESLVSYHSVAETNEALEDQINPIEESGYVGPQCCNKPEISLHNGHPEAQPTMWICSEETTEESGEWSEREDVDDDTEKDDSSNESQNSMAHLEAHSIKGTFRGRFIFAHASSTLFILLY